MYLIYNMNWDHILIGSADADKFRPLNIVYDVNRFVFLPKIWNTIQLC